ncbi:MAG: hypothetical protein K2P45_14230, partial [Eubacterium sp.]|nr:hypothetical protein [Eubacterium sp.]
SMKQAKVQGSVATKMEGRAGVLQSEIKLDKARGVDTQKKEEELAEVEQKAQEVASSQLSTLAGANKTMDEAANTDSRDESDDKDAKTTKEKDGDRSVMGADMQAESEAAPQQTTYVSLDIRL